MNIYIYVHRCIYIYIHMYIYIVFNIYSVDESDLQCDETIFEVFVKYIYILREPKRSVGKP